MSPVITGFIPENLIYINIFLAIDFLYTLQIIVRIIEINASFDPNGGPALAQSRLNVAYGRYDPQGGLRPL